jgi:hypothetical protein
VDHDLFGIAAQRASPLLAQGTLLLASKVLGLQQMS